MGESPISFYGREDLAAHYRENFPDSLDGAPVLLPMTGSAQRRSLEGWFDEIGVTPEIVAEFDDSALLKAFGEAGAGIFPAPVAIQTQLEHTYHVQLIGGAGSLKETYYAISPERVLRQAAVRHITEKAREQLLRLK